MSLNTALRSNTGPKPLQTAELSLVIERMGDMKIFLQPCSPKVRFVHVDALPCFASPLSPSATSGFQVRTHNSFK